MKTKTDPKQHSEKNSRKRAAAKAKRTENLKAIHEEVSAISGWGKRT
jgi:hypothetical protein